MLIDRYLPTFDETYIYGASVNATPATSAWAPSLRS
jgi:hypothetical protein